MLGIREVAEVEADMLLSAYCWLTVQTNCFGVRRSRTLEVVPAATTPASLQTVVHFVLPGVVLFETRVLGQARGHRTQSAQAPSRWYIFRIF